MADGSGLVLTDRNVWNVYSPNPPRIQWITTDKICIRTRRITASDTSDQFQYIGLDMFIGYGNYTNSIYLPYDSVSIMGYWNGDMTQPLANYSSGQDIEFVLDFKKWRNNWSTTTVKDYRNLPMANPSGIPGVQAGAQMTYLDLYKIFKASSAIYFRVFHRTRWACNSESTKFTDVGYIYSGYVDNFQHPTDGHTFNNGICVYPYKPLPYVLYNKANTNMSVQIAIPWTFRQHTGSSFTAVNDYVPSSGNTEFDIAITASVVGDNDVQPSPGISGTYGPGEHEIFRQKFTKNTNDRWGYHSFNKNISDIFPESKRGKDIAFRVWYNYNQNGGGWSGWETTGPDPDRYFTQYYLANEKCFPTMFYNRLPKFNVSQSCQVRNNTIADDYNVRWQCWDDDGDMIDFISDMYICNQAGSGVAHSYGWFSKSMSPGNYDETKNDTVLNILSHVSPNIDPSTYYNHHFELPASSADRFDAYNSNGSFAETVTSPRQGSKLICPYMIDFRPSNLSITFDRNVGEEFVATIHGNHPDWDNCKFYLHVQSEAGWEQDIVGGSWGDGTWQHFIKNWRTGNVIHFNLLNMYGEEYRGKRFKFYVAAMSKNGWDKHLGWTDFMVRLNDRPKISLYIEKKLGPTVYAEALASDQDTVETINVEFCLDNGGGNPDITKLWKRIYQVHGEPFINILEEITPKLREYNIQPNTYVGKKVFIRAGAIDRLGCERPTSDMNWATMIYDMPPDISISLESRKGEEAFIILETTYLNGLPAYKIIAELPNGGTKQIYSSENTNHDKRVRIRFSPTEHGFTDADRSKQFKFRAEMTNSLGQAMTIKSDAWTWNDIPRISIENIYYDNLNNGLIRRGDSTMKPTFIINSSDSDNVRLFGEIANEDNNENLKSVFSDNINAGTVSKGYTIDLKQFFKNPGVEFNFKTFRVQSSDIFNKYSTKAVSSRFRMLDGHKIEGINIEPSTLSTLVNGDISGKNFNVRIKFKDTPYAKNGFKNVVDLQLYRRNINRFRILYIKVSGDGSAYYNYIKDTCTVTLLDKRNDRSYISSLTYDNLYNSYDLVIIDACYVSLLRGELEKAKELADKGLPCYVIGNDTSENIFGTGATSVDGGNALSWRSGIFNPDVPFTNNITSVTLSSDSKTFYDNLNNSVFPLITSNGKHAVLCYTSPNDISTKTPYKKCSYVIQDNDYGLSQEVFIRLINFLIDTKKDFHTLLHHETCELSYKSGYTCKPNDIVKTFDGTALSLTSNQKVFAKARVRTLVNDGWDGDYLYYFEDCDKNFIYAPEPDKPSVIYPLTSSSTQICLKNPPIVISTGNQSNPANSQISDIRIKWNGQYYYATTHTQNFSNTLDNYNNLNIVFYPPSLLNSGTNRIEINLKSKLTNVWSPTTIHDIYIKDCNVIKTQGEIISAYLPPRNLINELRRAYGMSNYNYPSVTNGVHITYENHVNVLNKSFNEIVDKINSYCVRNNWCNHMNIGNQIFILASSTTVINNYLTKFNK